MISHQLKKHQTQKESWDARTHRSTGHPDPATTPAPLLAQPQRGKQAGPSTFQARFLPLAPPRPPRPPRFQQRSKDGPRMRTRARRPRAQPTPVSQQQTLAPSCPRPLSTGIIRVTAQPTQLRDCAYGTPPALKPLLAGTCCFSRVLNLGHWNSAFSLVIQVTHLKPTSSAPTHASAFRLPSSPSQCVSYSSALTNGSLA